MKNRFLSALVCSCLIGVTGVSMAAPAASSVAVATSAPQGDVANKAAPAPTDQLDQTVTNLTHSVEQFQQNFNQRLAVLQRQEQVLQSQLSTLQSELLAFSQALQHSQQANAIPPSFMQMLKNLLGDVGFDAVFVAFILLLLVAIYFLWPRKSAPVLESTKSQVERTLGIDDEEYDYLGSKESVPAKLDLARAYMDMDDKQNARAILKTVLKQGDKPQRDQARSLLNAMR